VILLPQVTLFGVDVVTPMRTMQSMLFSMRHVQFADAVLLTDLRRFNIGAAGVRVIHHTQGNHSVSIGHRNLYPDYERSNLLMPSWIGSQVKTSHVLFQEWDALVLNPWVWNEKVEDGRTWGQVWLSYDLCGAPWVAHCDYTQIPCDGHTNNVGNGGFQLRSMKFCKAVRILVERFKDDPIIRAGKLSADVHPCIVWRPILEKEFGIKFAPEHIARKFAAECRIYGGEFGFHGRETARLNGWRGKRGTWSECMANIVEIK